MRKRDATSDFPPNSAETRKSEILACLEPSQNSTEHTVL